jgi:hypothetical protein
MTFGAFNVMRWKKSGENVTNSSKLNKAQIEKSLWGKKIYKTIVMQMAL